MCPTTLFLHLFAPLCSLVFYRGGQNGGQPTFPKSAEPLILLVGLGGLEPQTSSMSTKRCVRLTPANR